MKNSFRYKCKIGTEGVNSRFFKDKLVDNINCFHGTLKLPKPWNNAELAMLSKFIYGVELSVRFEYCYDFCYHLPKFADAIKECGSPRYGQKNTQLARYLKLRELDSNKKDYIPESAVPYGFNIMKYDKKMVLIYLRYFCNQKHNDIYDSRFNHVVFNSSYEVDSYFWRHCIGEVSCGGIASSSYGQVEITSFNERDRILNFIKYPNQTIRRSFRKQMEKLIELDKTYNEKSVEV